MTAAKSYRKRALMYLAPNCVPWRVPIDRTLVLLMCMSQWPEYALVAALLLILSWIGWLAQQVVGMPVDIFENFRAMRPDAEINGNFHQDEPS